jgi:2-aminoadipate transaminase
VHFIEASHDRDGIDVDELERAVTYLRAEGRKLPKLIYNVVDFHNPTGVAMSLRRRQALLDLSVRHDIAILEDNPYRRVRFEGKPLPTLKALDAAGNVLHVGTFSKLIAPGLRIGWIAAHPHLIARLMQLKSDGGSNPLIQRIVLDFCRSEAFPAHIQRVQSTYREHRDRMIAALRRELPQASIDVPEGGYYVWVTLPAGLDGDALALAAARTGVNIIPGTRFFVQPGDVPWRDHTLARNHIRLSYSFATLEQIDEGVRRLASVCRTQSAG